MIFDISEKVIELKDDEGKGNGVTIKVKPLNVADYQKLVTVIRAVATFESADKSEAEQAVSGLEKLSDEKVSTIIMELLPKYCSDLTGIELKDNDKSRPATIKDVISVFPLGPKTGQGMIIDKITDKLIKESANRAIDNVHTPNN